MLLETNILDIYYYMFELLFIITLFIGIIMFFVHIHIYVYNFLLEYYVKNYMHIIINTK